MNEERFKAPDRPVAAGRRGSTAERRLLAGGQATLMTHRVNGKQMVLVATGGHGSFGTTPGDAVVAYTLK